ANIKTLKRVSLEGSREGWVRKPTGPDEVDELRKALPECLVMTDPPPPRPQIRSKPPQRPLEQYVGEDKALAKTSEEGEVLRTTGYVIGAVILALAFIAFVLFRMSRPASKR